MNLRQVLFHMNYMLAYIEIVKEHCFRSASPSRCLALDRPPPVSVSPCLSQIYELLRLRGCSTWTDENANASKALGRMSSRPLGGRWSFASWRGILPVPGRSTTLCPTST